MCRQLGGAVWFHIASDETFEVDHRVLVKRIALASAEDTFFQWSRRALVLVSEKWIIRLAERVATASSSHSKRCRNE